MAMALDEGGSLYCAGRGGVWVVSPEAKELGLIAVPEFCSNVTFGGEDGKTLYLTCEESI
jgi:gluconolactonase